MDGAFTWLIIGLFIYLLFFRNANGHGDCCGGSHHHPLEQGSDPATRGQAPAREKPQTLEGRQETHPPTGADQDANR